MTHPLILLFSLHLFLDQLHCPSYHSDQLHLLIYERYLRAYVSHVKKLITKEVFPVSQLLFAVVFFLATANTHFVFDGSRFTRAMCLLFQRAVMSPEYNVHVHAYCQERKLTGLRKQRKTTGKMLLKHILFHSESTDDK